MENNIQQILKIAKNDAKNDVSLFSQVDIEKMLKEIDSDKHNYLENKTMSSINKELYDELQKHTENINTVISNSNKLKDEYVLITEIFELKKSRYLRYMKKGDDVLLSGGVLVDIKFLDNGVYLTLLLFGKKIIKIKMDDYIIFQKLNANEKIILLSFEYITKFGKE